MKAYHIILPMLVAASIVGAFLTGRTAGKRAAYAALKPQADTVYHHDTVRVSEPVEVTHTVLKEKRVEVPVYIHTTDTVIRTLYLPREERIYRDTAYMAVVSGVDPSLDYLEIYRKDKEVTTTVERVVRQRPRWSIGVKVGYGAYLAEQPDFAPYIGVGISYNILSFGQRSHR